MFLLCFCSVKVVGTLLVLVCTENFSTKFYWWSLTDEQILAALLDLLEDDSRDTETKNDDDNYDDCMSLGRQERSKWAVQVRVPQADNYSCKPPEIFHTNVFLPTIFD